MFRVYRKFIGRQYSTKWLRTDWISQDYKILKKMIDRIKNNRNGVKKFVAEYKIEEEPT